MKDNFEETKGVIRNLEDGQTNPIAERRTKGQTIMNKTLRGKLLIVQTESQCKSGCFNRATSSCTTCGTPRVTHLAKFTEWLNLILYLYIEWFI